MVGRPELTLKKTREEDGALPRRIEPGDGEAMAVLFDRHGKVVYSVAFYFLYEAFLAEQVLSEVFLEVWRGTSRFHRFADNFSSSIAAYAHIRSVQPANFLSRLQVNGD